MEQTVEKKEVCQCKNCGNEAEMVFTCTLPDIEAESETPAQSAEPTTEPQHPKKAKGTATCTHCGNEAEMWIDV